MLLFKLFIFLIYFGYASSDFGTKNADNYGPYEVEWEHYSLCRGPKMTNLTSARASLTRLENGDYLAYLNITFFDTTKVEEIKMNVYSVKDSGKVLLWNYIINKPCQHYALAAVIDSLPNVKNCVIKKGDFVMENNLTQIMKRQAGHSFFYGDYIFKVVVSAKKGNIVCLMFDPKFKKIRFTKSRMEPPAITNTI